MSDEEGYPAVGELHWIACGNCVHLRRKAGGCAPRDEYVEAHGLGEPLFNIDTDFGVVNCNRFQVVL